MNLLQLDLTLSVVGPRDRLAGLTYWPMALRLAAGFRDPPPDNDQDEAHALIRRSLPWNLWQGDLPEICLVNERGRVIYPVDDAGQPVPIRPFAPQAENPGFLTALQQEVEARAQDLWQQLSFQTAGGIRQEVKDTDTGNGKVPWPGLLKTLTDLCAPTPSALKATWFFLVPREAMYELKDGVWTLRDGAKLAAAPFLLEGGTATPVDQIPIDHLVFDYGNGSQAHCNLLSIADCLAHGLDELDNYWLSIRDSRDDSLLDLAGRLDGALAAVALVNALSLDEWAEACTLDSASGPRRCTAAELASALARWKKNAAEVRDKDVRVYRKRVLEETLAGMDDEPSRVLRQAYQKQAAELLVRVTGGTPTIDIGPDSRVLDLLQQRLLPSAFERVEPAPVGPGEGIQLVVGDERMRLALENQTQQVAVDDIAAIQLFARRSTDPALLAPDAATPALWHPLTAGHYAPIGTDDPGLASVDRIFGCGVAYQDDVLYRELDFRGANLVCRHPLQDAHSEELATTTVQELSLLLAPSVRLASDRWELKAVPLRYGDHYEFAASVIDRAGGQALELCKADEPWSLDLARLQTLNPPQRDPLHFLRRVPVGSCNLLPPAGSWPQTPDNVVLRCLEEAAPAATGKRPNSICLVPRTDGFVASSAWPSRVAFRIEPPRTDEHTALRWLMPPTDGRREARLRGLEEVQAVLTGILRRRDLRMRGQLNDDRPDLVPDPAVSALGLRWQADGESTVHSLVLPADAAVVEFEIGDTTGHAGGTRFTVAQGQWLRVGVLALVEVSAFERMDAWALRSLVESGDWLDDQGRRYRAFEEDVVFAECATQAVLQPDADLLSLVSNAAGDVEVRYAFDRVGANAPLLAHLHRMQLSSERWTWRNMPIPPRDEDIVGLASTAEWRRRLASGPPVELMHASSRDRAPQVLAHFDPLAALDGGFVLREPLVAEFPRRCLQDTVLFSDKREGITGADYLRYTWTVRSRYAGVLVEPERSTQAVRRIAVAFRGDVGRIKPPRVLAVIPLLQQVSASPRLTQAGDGTPFLVIFDDVWFREYGQGERIGARIARVKREIGETQDPEELRYGPLPDHLAVLGGPAVVLLQQELDCFGPFGFSLDRSDEQAQSNATGFVVYPPAGTPAHYNLFVEFQRLLDLPSGNTMGEPLRSDVTEAVPLYAMPDSTHLWRAPDGVQLQRQDAGRYRYAPATFDLTPFQGATGAVLSQYRYILIVGRMARDGGRAIDVFIPRNALWLDAGEARLLEAVDKPDYTHGVVAEILLSGRHERGGAGEPLAGAGDLRALFRQLLPGPDDGDLAERDAVGMIRRFSAVSRVRLQEPSQH